MKKITKKVALIFSILFILSCGSLPVSATAFYDVPDDFWAAPYITSLESRGIVSGYGDGYFLPHNNVQRCEYAKMLVNASGIRLSTLRTSPYADLDVNEWYFPYINSITAQMPGYQSTTEGDSRIYFKPFDYATREDVTVALMRVLNYDLSEYYPVSDYLLSDVFYDYDTIPKQDRPYIAEAVKRGYITGTQEGTFLGTNPITRCEVSAVLFRAFPDGATAYVENNEQNTLPSDIALGFSDMGEVRVHYLDVGQGDSEFIELPNGETMLIDASTSEYGGAICEYISSLGYGRIDYLIATHPHADHVGGMTEVINTFEIGTMYMPNAETNTKTFERLLETIIEKQIPVVQAAAGLTVVDKDGVSVVLLAPNSSSYSDLNNYSAVAKLSYGSTGFLFMGDAEEDAENEIMSAYGTVLSADVLKVGHHGSSSSSSQGFVAAVSPKFAVISCGAGNSYGHPTSQTLSTLSGFGVEILRTDIDGTVVFESNGSQVYRIK